MIDAFTRKVGPMMGITLAVLWGAPTSAWALQPLDTFVKSARVHSPALQIAAATADQQEANADVALGKVLPGISLRGAYTRNQYQAALPLSFLDPSAPKNAELTLQPFNQYAGTATLNVPLIDLAAFSRRSAATMSSLSSAAQREATALQVEAQVTQTYFQLLANMALQTSSEHALEVAQKNLQLTEDRFTVGSAALLDVDRAKADMERQFQQVSDAKLQVALTARSLESLTAVTPDAASQDANDVLTDDLHGEQGLDSFNHGDEQLPVIHAAVLNAESFARTARAQRMALVPALSGSFTETFGNVPNFADRTIYWAGGVALTWNFDYTSVANIHAADAGAVVARARESQARLDAHDALFRYWKTVETNIVRSRSAREQARVSSEAATLAQDRYAAGTATQLDLLQAQRDAFAADVSRIQADADLINSRAQLRFAAGVHYGN